MNDKITGSLRDGYEYPIGSGNMQKDFILRPCKVRDVVALYNDHELIAEYGHNIMYMDFAEIAICLDKLGDVPKDKICPGLLMELSSRDGGMLLAAARGLLSASESDKPAPAPLEAASSEAPSGEASSAAGAHGAGL